MLTKPRTILVLLCIFLAGAVSGVFLAPLVHRPGHERRMPRAFHERNMDRLEHALALEPAQRADIEALMRATGEELAALRRDSWRDSLQRIRAMNTKIAARLTPEQRVKFEAFQREQLERLLRRQSERDQRRGHGRGDLPPPPPEGAPADAPPPPNE